MQRKPFIYRLANTLLVLFLLQACGGGGGGDPAPKAPGELDDAKPYIANALYSDVIADCVRVDYVEELCTLNTLPYIGLEKGSPTINDIMERVVVSHDWMGARFRQLLAKLPAEMLTLFQPLTAIVIDADIRPSQYIRDIGAIYLDPFYLWLTVNEKQTISKGEDYRSDFKDPLSFRVYSRYLKDGQQAFDYGSLDDYSTRDIDDIVMPASSLLLHELAHANDFIPPAEMFTLRSSETPKESAERLASSSVSVHLADVNPLTSQTLISLASVMYRGDTPTQAEIAITASEVGAEFAADGASDDYAYNTGTDGLRAEDVAMLFENTMMKYFFDTDYEIVFTNAPDAPFDCQDFIIAWGEAGRIGDDKVKPRAQLVVDAILPDLDTALFFQNLEAPVEVTGDMCAESTSIQSISNADKPGKWKQTRPRTRPKHRNP